MKRPGIASTVWFLAFVGATILLFRQAPGVASRDDDILFAPKNFVDSGDQWVGISGTLTGDGVAYKNNTMVVSCEKDRKECFFYSIEATITSAASTSGDLSDHDMERVRSHRN